MPVTPSEFGIDDFAFPVVESGGGGSCDYPAVEDVQAGVVYGSGLYVGTYGAGSQPQEEHSPADILRWLLIDLGVLGMPPAVGVWPGHCNYEPAVPDECVTIFDTLGNEDGRDMNSGALYTHPGIQVRVRSKANPVGHKKASQIRTALAESINLSRVTIDGVTYLVQAASRISQVLPAGRETPNTTGRFIHTLNAMLSIRKL